MPYYCTVPRCTSMAGKAKNVSFHQFPRDEDLAKLWNNILKRGKPYTKYSKVCSLHFKPEDYTITSAGKNKGQWRTLRKDAIPSQNLPSDIPATYQGRQSSSWMSDVSNNTPVIAPQVQQQLAQAIYMQTMLAMQVAGVAESVNTFSNGLPQNFIEQESQIAQTSTLPQDNSSMSDNDTDSEQSFHGNEHSLLQDNNTMSSYKCDDCSKCFKDPDVFIIHKRSHNSVNLQSGKENFDLNSLKSEMLKSNPILANLLKNTVEKNIFDTNLLEKQLMASFSSVDFLSRVSNGDNFDNCDSSVGDNLDDNNLDDNKLVIDERDT